MQRILLIISIFLTVLAFIGLSCKGKPKTTFLSIGTGGTGGVYYPYGGGLAEIWSQNVPGIKAVAEVTAASVENVKLAHKGETVIGEIMGDVAYQAYHGKGKFDQDGPQKILVLAAMYPNILHVVTLKNSGVENLRHLVGKIVSTGAPGSGTAFMSDLVFDAMEIPQKDLKIRRLSFIESANALRDHTINVGVWCVAPPTSSIMDLATTRDIRILPFSSEEQKKVCEKYPFYSDYNITGGIYRGVDEQVPTISVWNVIICKADLDEELIYNLTKVLFEQNEYMQQIHPFARYTTMENTVKHSPVPLHPGTVKYLKERGLTIPDDLIPGS